MQPTSFSTSKYNIQDLPSDRKFEEFMHRIFQARIQDDLKTEFDLSYLMPGVAERGIDILLKYNGNNKGAVQCKFNTSGNLNKADAAKEIIKFALYYHLDNSLISDINNFKYFLVVSGKFSSTTIQLLSGTKGALLSDPNIQLWTEAVVKKYTSLNHLTYANALSALTNVLSNINIILCSTSEINKWLHSYPTIASEFFEVKKVIDSTDVTKGLKEIVDIISPDLEKKYQNFLECYKSSAINHLDSVKFIGHHTSVSNTPRNMTVSKLYVDPTLTYKLFSKNDKAGYGSKKEKQIKPKDIFNNPKNHIILGDPGAGKSLLVKNIIIKLLKQRNSIGGLSKVQNNLPIRIELRKYSEAKSKSTTNFISYLQSLLQSEYQIQDVSQEIIHYIVQTKPTLFFFDGLDEIFDTVQKNIIRDDIVNFITVNKLAKAVITSRFIGYHDVDFPEKLFNEYSINNFSGEQINSFVEKFYATQLNNKAEREREAQECKSQLKDVSEELKSNPLILSLMAMLALNNIVIPDSKLEVYRSVTNTLVETRDKKEKELDFKLKIKSVRGTFGSLSFWQYCQITDKQVVNNIRAKGQLTKYLLETEEFKDNILAEDAAKSFLEYAESRSIYFDNNFTHKTFLEYYTADYIYTRLHNSFNLVSRDEVLSKYISNSSWHIVFELLLSMIDEQIVSNNVIDELLSKHIGMLNAETDYFLLSQLGRISNISKEILVDITKSCINTLLKGNDIKGNASTDFNENTLFQLLQRTSQAEEQAKIVQQLIFEYESSLQTDKEAINFYIFVMELNNYWSFKKNSKEPRIFKINDNERVTKLQQLDFILFSHMPIPDGGAMELIQKQIVFFGLESIFKNRRYKFIKHRFKISTFDFYLWKNDFSSESQLQKELSELDSSGVTLSLIQEQSSAISFHGRNEHEQIKGIVNLNKTTTSKQVKDFTNFLIKTVGVREIKKTIPDFQAS